MMQSNHLDASLKYYSLDDIYYFGGQQEHNVVAIENHKTSNSDEIQFYVGDLLGIAGNEKNGYSVGVNRRTGRRGQYPSYKVEDNFTLVDF